MRPGDRAGGNPKIAESTSSKRHSAGRDDSEQDPQATDAHKAFQQWIKSGAPSQIHHRSKRGAPRAQLAFCSLSRPFARTARAEIDHNVVLSAVNLDGIMRGDYVESHRTNTAHCMLTYETKQLTFYHGDCRDILPGIESSTVNCCVTSPPYWGLRDYGVDGQLGLEKTPEEYVTGMVSIFREVRRILRDDGTLWLNLGDSYAGSWGAQSRGNENNYRKSTLSGAQIKAAPITTMNGSLKHTPGLKPKDLVGIPWLVAFALRADGWYLRQDIIWHKPAPMPESVKDRCTKSHEYVFLLSKSEKYHYDSDAIAEHAINAGKTRTQPQSHNGTQSIGMNRPASGNQVAGSVTTYAELRNKRSVWSVNTQPYKGAHFAVFPEKLVEPCILAGCPESGTVLDPFLGSGTTARVAARLGRRAIGCDLNAEYLELAKGRCREQSLF